MTSDMEEDTKDIRMEMFILVTLKQEKLMEKVSTLGITQKKSTMENGSEELDKVMVCGKTSKEIFTWGNGLEAKL